jgi:hypothetical protein
LESLIVIIMMKDKIDDLIEELYRIEPTLKEKPGIRAIVQSLIDARPDIKVDPAFAGRLRNILLAQQYAPDNKIKTYDAFSTWLMRLAPIGAIAILLLIIRPIPERPVEQLDFSGPQMLESAPGLMSLPAEQDKSEAGPRMMIASEEPSLFVQSQRPGREISVEFAYLDEPGYVAIFTAEGNTPGELIGVSSLLAKGRTDGLVIRLSRNSRAGEMLYAGIFKVTDSRTAPLTDMPVLDSLGKPVYAIFDISDRP